MLHEPPARWPSCSSQFLDAASYGTTQHHFRQPFLAHNELIQQFYAYGLIGVCIFLGIYGSMYLQIRKLPAGHTKTLFPAFLIFILMRGLGDTEPFNRSLPLWAFVTMNLLLDLAVEQQNCHPIVISNVTGA